MENSKLVRSSEDILLSISKDVVEEFELVRKLGVCNMYSTSCVVNATFKLGFSKLREFIVSYSTFGYMTLLTNYKDLIDKFEICGSE